ncbi:MAG: ATP-binding cassette domain-containing protein [Thermoprotei archaeon]
MSAVTSTDSEPLLSVRDLSVEYTLRSSLFGSSRFKLRALDHVTLDVKQGEVVTVIGESGSGKTTLGLACLLLIKPSLGEVYFKGTRLNQLLMSTQPRSIRTSFQAAKGRGLPSHVQ